MKRKLASIFLTLVITLMVTVWANAQQSVELIMDNFTSSVVSQTNTLINNAAVESSMRNANAKRKAGSVRINAAKLAYTPSKQLQQKTVQDLGNQLKARNAEAGQAFNNALGAGKADYSQLFAQMVSGSGLPANNAATALAAYLETGYMIVNNVQTPGSITTAMDRGLQKQMSNLLSQNAKLASPTAVAQLGEQLKLQTVVLYLGWQSSLKSPQINQFRTGIAQQFKGMGLDLNKVKLTNQGFVKK